MNRNDVIKKWEASNLLEGMTDHVSSYVNNFFIDVANSVPEINLILDTVEVKGESRKLRTTWTTDLVQEINFIQTFEESLREENEKIRIKKQRYKDRKMYIRMIEEWSGEKVNKTNARK